MASEYCILITRSAKKDFEHLPEKERMKIISAIRKLSPQPRSKGVTKLKLRDGWRIRIGDYRVIFTINDEDKEITVFGIKHRRDIYRGK